MEQELSPSPETRIALCLHAFMHIHGSLGLLGFGGFDFFVGSEILSKVSG